MLNRGLYLRVNAMSERCLIDHCQMIPQKRVLIIDAAPKVHVQISSLSMCLTFAHGYEGKEAISTLGMNVRVNGISIT